MFVRAPSAPEGVVGGVAGGETEFSCHTHGPLWLYQSVKTVLAPNRVAKEVSMNLRDSTSPEISAPSRSVPCLPSTVVELGAHSLKFHTLRTRYVHTRKYPYDLGHEVFQAGRLSESTIRAVVRQVRASGIYPMFAIGTSALREAENSRALTSRLKDGLGITVRVLSCWEEASLLANGYLASSSRLPALIADVGGGSVEIVYLSRNRNVLWDSLPLGVIRVHYRFKADGRSGGRDWIDDRLARASVVMAEDVHVTGGTVKAVARTLRKTTFEKRDLEELADRVLTRGPPEDLRPERARVFLAGLTVILGLLEITRAQRLHYVDISIGRVLMSLMSGPRVTR